MLTITKGKNKNTNVTYIIIICATSSHQISRISYKAHIEIHEINKLIGRTHYNSDFMSRN